MRLARTLLAVSTAFASAMAVAHPGHDAPPVHGHDLEETLAIAAVIVLVAAAGWGLHAWRRKRKGRPEGRPF